MERLSRQNEEELLFKGKKIHCRKKPLFKGCGDLLVYSGYLKKAEDSKEEIVVRKIKKTDCDDKWEDIVTKHTREKDPIKHENVLKIISYEEMDEWRFFALEHYDATLEQYCKGIYRGPMPSNTQVLFQITNGLLYLHAEQCSHGNLTPRTILIASSQPVRMMIKLSEFGLSKFVGQCDGELGEEQEDGICQRKYWRLNGTTDNNQTPTSKHYNQDIFAAGCLCFYFLARGVHPFGYEYDLSSIMENIKKRNPVHLKTIIGIYGLLWELEYEPIENMIGDPPTDGKSWLLIAKTCFMKALPLRFEEENELGSGTFGVVYRGTFEGNAVAVKVFKDHLDVEKKKEQKREMEEHLRLDHVNVLKLLHVDELRDKTCLVLELCAGTLTDYCEKKYKEPELPPDDLVLYQIANGLHYIHSRNLVHRDVKPDNILISMTTPVQMKLSDFGFVKKISPQGTFTQQSGLKGTLNWMAAEILELMDDSITELPHGTIQSDTFAAGCVFFYFLTRGKHPFGNSVTVPGNVLKNKPGNLMEVVRQINSPVLQSLYELIGKMIKPKEDRIALPDVIEQLTTKLYASRKFKKFRRSESELIRGILLVNRFRPTEPVLACLVIDKVILLSADNSFIPFSNWKEKETQLELGHFETTTTMEWNADGTQLAHIAPTVIVCWSYPSGEILFQQINLNREMNRIEWNPFRPNVFAALGGFRSGKVSLFNSRPVDQRTFHFYTIEREKWIEIFQWISENRIALGLGEYGRGIEIWEIDKSMTSAQIVKRFQHKDYLGGWIHCIAWDERTKCLAACSSDGWMTIWSMDSDQPIHAEKGDGGCGRVAWRPNGKPTDDEGVDAARKSADNFILACGLFDGEIVIWTPLDLKKNTRILKQHSGWVESLSFSPDGRFLASASLDKKLIIWATEDWEPVYIDEGEERSGPFSWLFSSTDVPDYKLTFNSNDKVCVIEYAVGQCEKPGEDLKIVPTQD